MELDDLKKSWNILDEKLRKEEILDEEQVTELIKKYKSGAKRRINRITNHARLSVGVGVVAFVLFALVWMIVPSLVTDLMKQFKTSVMCIFLGVTFILGMLWDLKTYRWIQNTKVDEMPIVVVAERIHTFRTWIRYEITVIIPWIIVFLALHYWVMEFYELSPFAQGVFLVITILMVSAIIYFLYKKLIYGNLNELKKDLDELKELEAENQP